MSKPDASILYVIRLARQRMQQGFSLVEISIVLIIAGLALGGLLSAFGPRIVQQQYATTQEQMRAASDAIFGFTVLNRRLPCPASATSLGQEQWCTNATGGCGTLITAPASPPDHGRCVPPNSFPLNPNVFLPAATLGLGELGIVGTPTAGRAVDAWALPIRYAVSQQLYLTSTGTVGVGCNPQCNLLTAADGIKTSLSSGSVTQVDLRVCATNVGSTATNCAAGQEITRPAFLIWSTGRNGAASSGLDETENLDNDTVYVSRPRVDTFDDIFFWQPANSVSERLNKAGLLGP